MPACPRVTIEELYDEHADRVHGYCRSLCRNPAEADDLVQETFLLAMQCLDQYQGRGPVLHWLFGIARNRSLRLLAERGPATISLEEAGEIVAPPRDQPAAHVDRIVLDEALNALSPVLRESWELVKVQRLRYHEVATLLGVPQGTVHSRVHEASLRLKGSLRESSDEDPGGETPRAMFMRALP